MGMWRDVLLRRSRMVSLVWMWLVKNTRQLYIEEPSTIQKEKKLKAKSLQYNLIMYSTV